MGIIWKRLKKLPILKKISCNYFRLFYRNNMRQLVETSNQKRYIIMLTPIRGNLGDHAISYAEQMFIKDKLELVPVIEISDENYRLYKEEIYALLKPSDTILIQGGGFLGDLWIEDQKAVDEIISRLPNNKIVILPQTLFFSTSVSQCEWFEAMKTIYRSHKNLKICFRDRSSYELALKNELLEMNQIFYLPDMVLYVDTLDYMKKNREGILFCFRSDKEKCIENNVIKILETELATKYRIDKTDTVLKKKIFIRIYESGREEELRKKWDYFAEHKLILTDRLHGMIFAAITGTPCIAFDNCSRKVSGVYEWIKNIGYIWIVDSQKEVVQIAEKVCQSKDNLKYSKKELEQKFDILADIIRE